MPPPLSQEQRDELNRRADKALLAPITGTTLEALALESTRLATLADRTHLEQLPKTLEDHVRQQPSYSQNQR